MDDSAGRKPPPDDPHSLDNAMDLFDSLLEAANPAALLAAEADPAVRSRAERLWRHHLLAADQNFLEQQLDFQAMPVFEPGQLLLKRFEVERSLGQGGMGEVYLAFDRTLQERVALKTMARLLASSDWIKARFIAEVRNARRVTHPNVCRIHEIFDDGEIPFFAMELVEGESLSALLKSGISSKTKTAGILALQLAEGLNAAHSNGVVHGDFKPANVLVVPGDPPRAVIMDFGLARAVRPGLATDSASEPGGAGTLEYMAPELLSGALPSAASDIFAFGRVGQSLLPGRKIWDLCTRSEPRARPASLQPIVRQLKADRTRRYWVGGAILTVAGAIVYAERTPLSHFQLPEGARVLVNGFRAAAENKVVARLARGMFLTGVSQSLRVHPLADEDLLPALRKLQSDATLPVGGKLLEILMAQLRVAFLIDGEIQRTGERISLVLRLLRAGDLHVLVEKPFRDYATAAAASASAARWLRETSGESPTSIQLNSPDASEFSSSVPEALSKYYDARTFYAVGDMEQALPLFREAVRLDPKFAQAHSSLAGCLNSFGRFDEAYPEVELAFRLSRRLPDRERAWVEATYYTLMDDPGPMVDAATRNLSYNRDEPRFLRGLGYTLARCGNAEKGVAHLKRALELQPDSALLRLDLINFLCEAGLFAEALEAFKQRPDLAAKVPILHIGQASALLGLERYQEALAACLGVDGGLPRLPVTCQILMGHLDIAESKLIGELGRLDTHDNLLDRFETRTFLCGLYAITDRPASAASQLRDALDFPPIPLRARYLEEAAFWAARLGDSSLLATVREKLQENHARWPTGRTNSALAYVTGILAAQDLDTAKAEEHLAKACGVDWALWSLFDLAEFYGKTGKYELAENYWRDFDKRRGVTLSYFFPGVLLLAWLRRALSAQARGDRAASRSLARKVLSHWESRNPRLQVVQTARMLA